MNKKIAAVTGSRRGIGLAIAKTLARMGYSVVLSGTRSEEETRDVLDALVEEGLDASYLRCDISDRSYRQAFFEEIDHRFGRLDILVNNGGVAPKERRDVIETSEESFDYVVGTNLKGTFFMTQLAARYMIELQAASLEDYAPRIVNVSSISAYTSSVNRGEYCVSKAGISMVTQLFADCLAEYGIPVFEVRPGIILTDMTSAVAEAYEKRIADGLTPIRRMGLPQDVANCVAALASGMLDFATGQVINADGGFHIRRL